MAHKETLVINGQETEVTAFDHTAQEIDDAVDAMQSGLKIELVENYIQQTDDNRVDTLRQTVYLTMWPEHTGDKIRINSVSIKTSSDYEGAIRFAVYAFANKGDGTGVLTLEHILGDAQATDGEAVLTVEGGYIPTDASPVIIACAEDAAIWFVSETGSVFEGLPYFGDADYFDNAVGTQINCGTDLHAWQYPNYRVDYDVLTKTSITEWANSVDSKVNKIEGITEAVESKTDALASEIEQLRADFEYVEIEITSFSVTPSVVEAGAVGTMPRVTWKLNKVPAKLELSYDGTVVELDPVQEGWYGLTQTINKDTTFTLRATDEREAVKTKTATLNFYTAIYYGMAAMPETVNAAFVQSLGNKVLSHQKNRTFTVNGGEGLYFWYVYLVYHGESRFNIGGFDYEFEPTTLLMPANGRMQNHYVYRSDNPITDTVSVTVKDL